MLSAKDQKHLANRRSILKIWNWAGSFCLLGLLGFIIWLWSSNELFINPFATIAAIESGSMADTTLVLMAAMLPVLFILALFLILLVLVMVTVSLSNEKRYLAIIDSFLGAQDK